MFIDWHTWEQTAPHVTAYPVVERAAAAALRWHGDQRRPTGVPYAEHLFEALQVLVTGVGETDPDVLTAVLLHDVVEDTEATLADVEAEFGPVVAELVDWVTKPPPGTPGKAAKRAAKAAYLRRLAGAPARARRVKLADRVSNVQRLFQMSPDFRLRYHAETVTYILPLAAGEPFFEEWFTEWSREYAP